MLQPRRIWFKVLLHVSLCLNEDQLQCQLVMFPISLFVLFFFWIMIQDDPHGPISYLSETSSSPLFVYVGTNDLRLITIFL